MIDASQRMIRVNSQGEEVNYGIVLILVLTIVGQKAQ
jgi:hypothetical protein